MRRLIRNAAGVGRVRHVPVLIAAVVALCAAAGAWAYFTSTGSATAAATVGSISAPSVVAAQQTGANITISWHAATLDSRAAVQGYTVKRSDGTTICGSPTLNTSLSCTDNAVPAGTYTYTVTAVFNGFTASAASGSATILAAPTITQTPSNPSASGAPSFTFSGGGGSGYQCQLDAGSFTACTSPDALSGLSDGSHTFRVQPTRGASSGPSAVYAWTIDSSAPTITAKPASASNNASASLSFTHAESAYTFQCRLDGAAYSACTSPTSLAGLADGSHTFNVRALSADGTVTAAATYTWTVDTVAPVTTITLSPSAPNGSAGWYTTAPNFALNASDSGSGVASTFYRIDSGTTHTFGSAVTIPDGQHTVTYWSTDTAVNTEAQHTTSTIKVDTAPPTSAFSLAGGLIWGNYAAGKIGRANRDGTGVNQSLASGSSPIAVASDGTHVYWSNYGSNTISRANLDGTGVTTNFITGQGSVFGMTVDANYIYWTNYGGGVMRAKVNGSGVAQIITDPGGTTGVAVDGNYIYWSNTVNGTIGRANLDGSGAQPSFITGAGTAGGVAVDGSHIYWGSFNAGVGRADLSGANATTSFIPSSYVNRAEGVAVDGSYIYWGNAGSGSIGRASLSGASPNANFIPGSGTVPVYADGLAVVPTPANASLSGSTLYYNGSTSGAFYLTDAASDSSSGPASASFPDVATSGWTHAAETVSTGTGGAPTISYTSGAFDWSASPSNPSGYAVGAADIAGNSGSTPLTFVNDTTAPTGGALSVNGTAATATGSSSLTVSTTFPITSRSDYTDGQSGLRSSTLTVQSFAATGSASGTGACTTTPAGPFASAIAISGTTEPAGIAGGYCYVYTLTGTDQVANTASLSITVGVQLYQHVLAGSTGGGPVSLWLLGDGAGSTTAADSLGSSPMSANNSIGTTPVTFGSVSAPPGIGGTAVSLSGSGNYLHTSAPVTTTTTSWALEAWVNPSLPSEQTAFALYNGSDGLYQNPNSGGYGFGEGSGTFGAASGSCVQVLYGAVGWANNTGGCLASGWNYVEVSSNGTGYVNNVPFTFTRATPQAPNCATTIGTELNSNCGYRNGRQFTGAVAGAAVYTHALTSSDALAHWGAGH